MIGRRTFLSSAIAIPAFSLWSPHRLLGDCGLRNECQRIRLDDGRHLGFATYGDPQGWPVIYFHGIPTSRIEARFLKCAASAQGCRVIAIDRPGFGLSDFQCNRCIADWVDDITEFIDSPELPSDLNLNEFSIVGLSSGSPYALICAARLPESRLRSVTVVGGMAPLDQICGDGGNADRSFRQIERRPRLASILINQGKRLMCRRPDCALRLMSREFSTADCFVFFQEPYAQALEDMFLQAVRCGPNGLVHDISLLARPWGFCVEEIDRHIDLWYGSCDITTRAESMGSYLNGALADSSFTLVQGEGHLSIMIRTGHEILGQVIANSS